MARTKFIVIGFLFFVVMICGVLGYKSKTCLYQGREYYPGYVDIEPCVTCHCDGDTAEFTCSYKECPLQDDPSCIQYKTPTGQCCAECVQHGCNVDNKQYPLGARIPVGPCMYCYCPWEVTGTGGPTCRKIACPRLTCPGAYVPHGKCCPVCPQQKWR